MISEQAVQSIDAVGRPLADVTAELASNGYRYILNYTRPPRITFPLEEDILYVLYQRIDASNTYHLTVAAKMGKEA